MPLSREDILDGIDIDPKGCWIWAGKVHNGYGKSKGQYVHRAAYEIWIGPVPSGHRHHVEHRCNQKLCCNPMHLSVSSNAMNIKFAWRRKTGRMSRDDLRKSRFFHEMVDFS